MTQLERGFENDLREAVTDKIESELYADPDNLAFSLAQEANRNFQQYASRHGYDINHVWEDFTVEDAERTANGARVTIQWPGLTALFEFGVSPHTIRGNPLLHFYWEEADTWVQTEEVNWGSETGGIPESRAIREALHDYRRELQS